MAKPSTQSTSSMQAAKSKLEAALTRLEKAVETTMVSASDSAVPAQELVSAKAEVSQLKEKNLVVSSRLDGAIGRLAEILEG